ncbi:MAG: endo alpha-1,4 polygalactosaminidase [Candidatus Dormibacteria bacterium]
MIAAACLFGLVVAACGGPARPGPPAADHWWRPSAAAGPFIYQLQGSGGPASVGGVVVDPCRPGVAGCRPPAIFDIDLYEDSQISGRDDLLARAAVAAIRARGAVAVCYVDAGTWEEWRPDAHLFPPSVLGLPDGWPGERWLDIRRLSVLLPLMEARARQCREAGFSAIDWDNVDAYANRTGFRLTAAQQLHYNRDLAEIAHRLGLAVGLKNDYGQVAQLAPYFDFSVDEQCLQYRECGLLQTFVRSGKPVYDVEYQGPAQCPGPRYPGIWFSWQVPALRAAPWYPCPGPVARGSAPS